MHTMKQATPMFARGIRALAAVLAVLAAVWLAGRYGWKLRGFDACQSAGIERVEVTDGQVTLTGFDPGSFPEGFVGWYAEQNGDRLFVGFRFGALFGAFETGDFTITIPTQGTVNEIYIKTGQNEYQIWPKEEVVL